MPYPTFDRSKLSIRPLKERVNDLNLDRILPLDAEIDPFESKELDAVAERIVRSRLSGAPVFLFMGAHVIRAGNSNFIIDLMKRGMITHIGVNGACAIHDYEFARIGATTESVARYIVEGQFGLWQETGEINDIVARGIRDNLGFGEALGRAISTGTYPHKEISIFAAAFELKIPITVHVSVGQDIIHEHPNFDAAAVGEATYRDFLIFAQAMLALQHGVFINYGTAVMGPEVYLKALSMARNVARQQGETINRFTTAVFDLQDLGEDYHQEAGKSTAHYYFRPFKTLLVRTVSDGGESFYIRGDHRITFPNLYQRILKNLEKS